MGITAKEGEGGSKRGLIEEGIQHAICYAVYDLGTQYSEVYEKHSRKVLISWELPEHRITIDKDGKELNLPRAISKQYTVSLHEKATLRKDLESWRGRAFTSKELEGFDLCNVLGVNGMVQVIHRQVERNTYANVQTVLPLMKNMEKRKSENTLRYFSFEEDAAIPENTPDWIVEMIEKAEEWGKETHNGSEEESPPLPEDDDIPF